MKNPIILSCALAFVACPIVGWASPPACVTPQVLNRATFEPFHAKTDHSSDVDFDAKSKVSMDIVVRQHTYAAGCGAVLSNTGWHTHPAPVLITVKEGTLWFYEADDPTCTPKVVTAGQGYVDEGPGHIAVNPSMDVPAVDISVILAAPHGMFRGELAGGQCGF